MNEEKKEEAKVRLKRDLKRRVRAHRPAAKVLEITIALAEDRVDYLEDKLRAQKWELEYLKTVKPSEIEAVET